MRRWTAVLLALAFLFASADHLADAHSTVERLASLHTEPDCPGHADVANDEHERDDCPCPQHHDHGHEHGLCGQCHSPANAAAGNRDLVAPEPGTGVRPQATAAHGYPPSCIPGRTATGVSPPRATV